MRFKWFLQILFAVSLTWSAGLPSNFVYDVQASATPGELWVQCRGDADTAIGWSRLLLEKENGGIQVQSFTAVLFPQPWVGVHDNIFLELTGENRRTVGVSGLPWQIAQGFAKDSTQGFTSPAGLLVGNADSIFVEPVLANGLDSLTAYAQEKPLAVATHAIAVDKGGFIWLARGPWGLTRSAIPISQWMQQDAFPDSTPVWWFDVKHSRLRPWDSLDTKSNVDIWCLQLDTLHGKSWIATEKGLWKGDAQLANWQRITLGNQDSLRITGLWMSPSGFSLIAEASSLKKGASTQTLSSLWFSNNGGNTFAPVALPYDSLDVSVSSVAFVGPEAWLAVQGFGNGHYGLLHLGAQGPLPALENGALERWIWDENGGVLDRDVPITMVGTFSFQDGTLGLAASTNGAGLAISADSGRTWTQVLNQKPVKGGLQEVRMVPSVLRFPGTSSLVAYRLNKNAEVTIEVFSYDMRKVRTLVHHAPRKADPIRSSRASEDAWNGLDDAGNPAALGMYYVRVRTNQGQEAFGKILWLGAPR